MTLGEKLKKLRLEKNLTQEELASKLFVTRNAISKWETNRGIPNIDSLKSVASEFDVSLDYLLNEEELISITIENRQNIESTKNLVYAFLLFLVYVLIGTLIPYYSFESDPTIGIALFIIILPLCYIILGFVSVLLSMKWPYVVIASALAITPIFLFFDIVIPTVRLGYWAIIYYVVFLSVYFIASKVANRSIKVRDVNKLKKVFFILALSLSLIFVVHTTIACISLYYCITCSAPWYLELVFNIVIYIVPLTIFWVFYLYYFKESKKIQTTES